MTGRWVGRPQLKTIDYDIEIEFTPNPDGTIVGKLIRTTLPQERPVNLAFRNFRMNAARTMAWTFPNTQEWSFNGTLSEDGTAINGATNSAQGDRSDIQKALGKGQGLRPEGWSRKQA